ncbi:ABC transporter C family member 8 [Glycine soja]
MIGIMVSVTWQVLIVAVLAIVASKYDQGYYQASGREIIQINGTTKALMNFTTETSLGGITIRAFNMANRFFKTYLNLVDASATLFFHSNAAIKRLFLRIKLIHNLILFIASLLLVLLPKGYVAPGIVIQSLLNKISVYYILMLCSYIRIYFLLIISSNFLGLIGVSLSHAFSLTTTVVYLTQMFCNLSNYVIFVERIKQFIHIPTEPSAIVEDNRPPHFLPSKGRIDLQSLELWFSPLIQDQVQDSPPSVLRCHEACKA